MFVIPENYPMPMSKTENFIFDQKTLTYVPAEKSRTKWIFKLLIPFVIIPVITIYTINYQLPNPESSISARLLLKQKEQYFKKLNMLAATTDSLYAELQEMKDRDNTLYSTIVERSPLPNTMRGAGYGGSKADNNYNAFTQSIHKKTETILSQARVQKESFEQIMEKLHEKNSYWECMPVIPPIATKDLERKGDGFGRRFHPILKFFRPHEGIDLICDKGNSVYAPAKGIVIECRYSLSFGNVIKVKHTNNLITLYAHLSKFNVKEGQTINRGDVLGFAGSTGLSSGSHLHYEIHRNGIPVDPELFFHSSFTQDEYEQILSLNK